MRFAQLPEDERSVGARVRAVRTKHRLSQRSLASLIGLTRDRLNSIEIGRVALRFDPGWELCLRFDVNPVWLALGEGDSGGFVDYPGSADIFGDVLFSDVLRDLEHGDEFGRARYSEFRELRLRSTSGANVIANVRQFASDAERCRPDLVAELQKRIDTEDIKRYLIRSQMKRSLSWNDLRRRLRAVTRNRGSQAELARRLKVTPQAVAEWLVGASAPTADKTIRILNYVEDAEAKQQKQSAGVSEAPARKTPQRQSTGHGKSKSSRTKK